MGTGPCSEFKILLNFRHLLTLFVNEFTGHCVKFTLALMSPETERIYSEVFCIIFI